VDVFLKHGVRSTTQGVPRSAQKIRDQSALLVPNGAADYSLAVITG